MRDTVQICCKNNQKKQYFPIGSTIFEIYKGFDLQMPYPVVNARVNNQSEGLHYRVYNNKDVEFLDISSSSGIRVYTRSLCFVLCKAVHDLFPHGRMVLEHPVSNGYFCNLVLETPVRLDDISALKKRMQEIIKADTPIRRVQCHTEEAIEIFRKQDMEDKALLLETTGSLYTTYHLLDGYADYFYGPLLPSCGGLQLFDLVKYYDGLLLRVPSTRNPNQLGEIIKQEKMLEIFQEFLSWQKIMGLNTVGVLNVACQKGHAAQLIQLAEALQEKRIVKIADQIYERTIGKNPIRMVLISGPSSSGKTTFSKRLSIQLMANGLKPYPISLDNYFMEREQTPRDEKGDYDYESLHALDLELFNNHLKALFRGEEISLPTYNFITGKKEYLGETLKLDEKMVLVLEGIHGLNPELTKDIDDRLKFSCYVSALTTMSLDEHNWIPTTDTRLLRRIIRDFNYRGCSAVDTISRWAGVRAGEDKWIFPYQENADAMFNSALLFEFAVLRRFAEPILMSVPENTWQYSEASRLLNFLHYFKPIQEGEIPPTSLMREFLGGSSFKY